MRSIEEIRLRWGATLKYCTSLENLQCAVRKQGDSNPCVAGCRSVCWKVFLLFQKTDINSWLHALRQDRETYTAARDHFLNFIHHPEALAEISSDPLNDDPDSPWNTFRRDELLRAEIEQDVKRLPDVDSYHENRAQRLILDVLFIYCKVNPERGGYRQGMHELLAPIFYVVQQDAVQRDLLKEDGVLDEGMLETLDAAYIEHDTYSLFSKLMERAQVFYETKAAAPATKPAQDACSAIVERSKYVHEILLNRIDPELAAHLTSIEILPQIFLIEFPFDQFLVLWDTLFAIDPSLELIDLVSCAMLLRIRWQLLQADYSVCLQLLLKYPAPDPQQGAHTFVDDAIYLQDHIDFPGGSTIIQKYTDRSPADTRHRLDSVRQRSKRNSGALRGQTVEQLFQGAAKSAREMYERSEKLGINQAVRDAVGEVRRNMQSLNDGRIEPRARQTDVAAIVAAMERREKQLASLLDETVAELKTLSASKLEDKAKSLEVIEVAAAKVQFVQIYLQDSTMDVPLPPTEASKSIEVKKTIEKAQEGEKNDETNIPRAETPDGNAKDIKPEMMTAKKSEGDAKNREAAPTSLENTLRESKTRDTAGSLAAKKDTKSPPQCDEQKPKEEVGVSSKEMSRAKSPNSTKPGDNHDTNAREEKTNEESRDGTATVNEWQAVKKRPQPPVPTRSTIAQSSFSWMLEPDESISSIGAAAGSSKRPGSRGHEKRGSNSFGRERNAFLFGDESEIGDEGGLLESSGIFGLESMSKRAR